MTSTTPGATPILHAYLASYRQPRASSIDAFVLGRRKRKRKADPDGLLDAQQAAAVLGMTVPQLMAHVSDRSIKSINVGRGTKRPRYRFDRTDLDAFKTSRRSTLLEQPPCPSTSKASSITSTSSSKVIGFLDQRAKRRSKKPSR